MKSKEKNPIYIKPTVTLGTLKFRLPQPLSNEETHSKETINQMSNLYHRLISIQKDY